MKIQNITVPKHYPITIAEAKKQCEIDDLDIAHDDYISALIMSATAEAEQYLHRRLVSQTLKYFLDYWPNSDRFRLPFGRLQSIESINYTDSAGVVYTLDSGLRDIEDEEGVVIGIEQVPGDYIVDTTSEPGLVVLGYEKEWPTVTLYPSNPIEAIFTCGYYAGDTWLKETLYSEEDQVIPVNRNGLVYSATTPETDEEPEEGEESVIVPLVTGTTSPVWPLTIGDTVIDGTIEWVCIGVAVPEPIRQAIKIMISDMFEYRETEYFGINHTKLKTIESLLFPYKLFGWVK